MKRKIFVAAVAVCLIAIVACGSLAYFTASHSVTNTFMTATTDPSDPRDPADKLFSVEVIETDPETGKPITGTTNTYKDMLPGTKFAKDPVIKNTGEYGQWIRVTVTFDKVSAWKTAGVTYDKLFSTLVTKGFSTDKWDAVDPVQKDDTAIYVFYMKGTTPLGKNDTIQLFEEVTIPTSLNQTDLAALNGFTINVKADAIQSENTGVDSRKTFENSDFWKD